MSLNVCQSSSNLIQVYFIVGNLYVNKIDFSKVNQDYKDALFQQFDIANLKGVVK